MSSIAVLPGTFDPITLGHLDLIQRGSALFDQLIVAIAKSDAKNPLFHAEERRKLAEKAVARFSNVTVHVFDNLLVDFAASQGAHIILRGVRNTIDWEYEKQLAYINQKLKHSIETLFMLPTPEVQHIASSLIKDIARHQGDIRAFVPTHVADAIAQKIDAPTE